MRRKKEIWAIISLEVLFGLCALSVLVYRILGLAFNFNFLSYRVFNILISLIIIGYIVRGLLSSKRGIMLVVVIFSLFHLIEGLIIQFYFKAVIHFLILGVVVWMFLRIKK